MKRAGWENIASSRNMTVKDFKGADGNIYQVFAKKVLGKPFVLKTKWMKFPDPRARKTR